MIFTIAGFEFRQRLRRISTYVYFLIFGVLSCLFVFIAGGGIRGSSIEFGTGGKVLMNSPYALNVIISYVSFLGLVVTAAIAGNATFQDIESRCTEFFFSAPIAKFDYLAGRFLGALAIQLLIFASVGMGAWIGTHLPGIDAARVGPQIAAAYFQPYLLLVLPNLFLLTAIFFGLAALGKKMLPVYAGSVILLIGYFAASQLSTNLTVGMPGALMDPLGGNAIDRVTQYWTPFQRNTRLIPFAGILLLNRLLWLGVGGAILALTYARFSIGYSTQASRRGKPVAAEEETEVSAPSHALPVVHPVFSRAQSLGQFLSLTRIQFTETVRNVFFIVLMLAGGLFAIFSNTGSNNPFATRTYPVTYQMLQQGTAGFFIFALAIITFYAGELVWRERDASVNQIVDAFPVQRWVVFASKLISLMLVQVLIMLVILVAGLIVQVFQGYHHFELGLYFTDLFGVQLVPYWILCVLALLIHTLVNNSDSANFCHEGSQGTDSAMI
jgi:ABC-2 type transport system permease protein